MVHDVVVPHPELLRCQLCGAKLKQTSKVVWLELDFTTGRYHKLGEVPEEHSQGCFPFGADCAPKVLREKD